jgi:hypothetical protein
MLLCISKNLYLNSIIDLPKMAKRYIGWEMKLSLKDSWKW